VDFDFFKPGLGGFLLFEWELGTVWVFTAAISSVECFFENSGLLKRFSKLYPNLSPLNNTQKAFSMHAVDMEITKMERLNVLRMFRIRQKRGGCYFIDLLY